jgi:hypothetical protein
MVKNNDMERRCSAHYYQVIRDKREAKEKEEEAIVIEEENTNNFSIDNNNINNSTINDTSSTVTRNTINIANTNNNLSGNAGNIIINIQYFIHSTTKTFSLHESPQTTIAQVKQKILDKKGIPISVQQLVYLGRILADDCTLASCSIKDQSLVHLAIVAPHPWYTQTTRGITNNASENTDAKNDDKNETHETTKLLASIINLKCPFSLQPIKKPVRVPCGHVFDRNSLALLKQIKCPVCSCHFQPEQVTVDVSLEQFIIQYPNEKKAMITPDGKICKITNDTIPCKSNKTIEVIEL